jgi:dipeptidyl aminopeptidase/acylaminoacyl peptidase
LIEGGTVNRMTLGLAGVAAAMGFAAAPAQATFPGNNGLLVFQRPVGRQIDLFTVTPNGRALRRLTRTKAWAEKAEWSPDGQRLAFARSRRARRPRSRRPTRAAGTCGC